jgi:hypothetical protein
MNTAPRVSVITNAAERALDVLTTWLREHPDATYHTDVNVVSKRIQLHISTPTRTHTFQGEDLQDAYAQAAQTIMFNSGAELL